MKSILVKRQQDSTYRTLDAGQKAKAALEALRGKRSVADIARHWQVDPNSLLQWQYTLVERASSLFDADQPPASAKLGQAQVVNEAMIGILFEHMDAREALREKEVKLHRLLAYQDQLKEEERQRIALEIHDELGQNLLAIRLDISSLQNRTRHHQGQLHQRVGLVLGHIDGAIKSVRSMIGELRPFELELGLPAALQWQVNRFRRMTGIEAMFSTVGCDDDSAAIDGRVTLALFRTLQEAMNIIARNTDPTRVNVLLHRHAGSIELKVEDNGAISCLDAPDTATVLSLESMAERLALLGGDLQFDMPVSGGTCMSCKVPLRSASQSVV